MNDCCEKMIRNKYCSVCGKELPIKELYVYV